MLLHSVFLYESVGAEKLC